MKADNTRLIYMAVSMLSLILIAQWYLMHTLHHTSPFGVESVKTSQGFHHPLILPEQNPFSQMQELQHQLTKDVLLFEKSTSDTSGVN